MLQIETDGLLGPSQNKKAACEPVEGLDRGYAAETRP